MATVTQLKCACDSCLCIVDISSAVHKSDRYYCSNACANDHAEGATGCAHSGCGCSK